MVFLIRPVDANDNVEMTPAVKNSKAGQMGFVFLLTEHSDDLAML